MFSDDLTGVSRTHNILFTEEGNRTITFFRHQSVITVALKRERDIVIGGVPGMITFLSIQKPTEEQPKRTGMNNPRGQV